VNGRFVSLDVFRGATVALMILVNNPGTWNAIYPPLAHAPWHGCTPTDLVFPFFLFAVGNALAFVMPALVEGPAPAFWRRVIKRTLLIFLIGLFLNASPFVRWDAAGELAWRNWETLRFMGVLQRIALCFGAAAVVVWLCARLARAAGQPRWADSGPLWVAAALLLGYWVACATLGASADPYSLSGFFGTAIDTRVLGAAHLYKGEGVPFDPEGLASTPPAIAQVLLGWWAGRLVLQGSAVGVDLSENMPRAAAGQLGFGLAGTVTRLFLCATGLLVLAYLWQLDFPLNKKIWTSSYVLHTTGLAMMGLALCIYVIDIRRQRPSPSAQRMDWGWGWARFFEVFGKNPLFIFVLSGFVPRVLSLLRWQDGNGADGTPLWTSPLPWLYKTVFAPIGTDPRLGSLLFACANLGMYAVLVWWLDKRQIYIRV
jgi:predicted acyltransferase